MDLAEHILQGEYYGMQTFNQSLMRLIQAGLVTNETALNYATSPEELRLAMEGLGTGTSGINPQD